nr:MAG TPA: hypothetical protein [Caudoviricetes sp.]
MYFCIVFILLNIINIYFNNLHIFFLRKIKRTPFLTFS